MSFVIILANGKSHRFGSNKLKKYIENNKTVLETTIEQFQNHEKISKIYIVGSFTDEENKKFIHQFSKITKIISGGNSRYESFCLGIENITENNKILIHNAANPFVSSDEISEVLENISENTAVGVGRKTTNTIRQYDEKKEECKTLNRENIFAMETPQGAYASDFKQWICFYEKYKTIKKFPQEITDELMLAEISGGKIKIIPASDRNIKITYESDISQKIEKFPITGFGIDSHQFEKKETNKKCMLCNIEIENSPAFKGNSDADVALHALCNAILSSIGENSFSVIADPLCKKGITNSAIYLEKILSMLKTHNKKIIHCVLSFEGLRPKIEKYFPLFRTKLSQLLHISENSIGLNATTGEKLDGYGKGEGMKVSCMVTLL